MGISPGCFGNLLECVNPELRALKPVFLPKRKRMKSEPKIQPLILVPVLGGSTALDSNRLWPRNHCQCTRKFSSRYT